MTLNKTSRGACIALFAALTCDGCATRLRDADNAWISSQVSRTEAAANHAESSARSADQASGNATAAADRLDQKIQLMIEHGRTRDGYSKR